MGYFETGLFFVCLFVYIDVRPGPYLVLLVISFLCQNALKKQHRLTGRTIVVGERRRGSVSAEVVVVFGLKVLIIAVSFPAIETSL